MVVSFLIHGVFFFSLATTLFDVLIFWMQKLCNSTCAKSTWKYLAHGSLFACVFDERRTLCCCGGGGLAASTVTTAKE